MGATARSLIGAAVAAALIVGCGGDDDASGEDGVRETIEAWTAAADDDDHETYCDLLSDRLRAFYDDAGNDLAKPGESACAAFVATQAELGVDDADAEVVVDPIVIDDDSASATVTISLPEESSEPISAELGLTRDDSGEWRIDDTGLPPPG